MLGGWVSSWYNLAAFTCSPVISPSMDDVYLVMITPLLKVIRCIPCFKISVG